MRYCSDKYQCERKNPIKHCICKKDYVCEINEYLKNYVYMKSHIDDSVFTCYEVIDVVVKRRKDMLETVSINSHDKNAIYKVDYYICTLFY